MPKSNHNTRCSFREKSIFFTIFANKDITMRKLLTTIFAATLFAAAAQEKTKQGVPKGRKMWYDNEVPLSTYDKEVYF